MLVVMELKGDIFIKNDGISMKIHILVCVVAILSLSACAGSRKAAPEFCGESFCLSGVSAKMVQSESPVEDFVVHKLKYKEKKYSIYEGNAPELSGEKFKIKTRWNESWAVKIDKSC